MSEKQLEDFWNKIKHSGIITGCWQGMEYKDISEWIDDDLKDILEAAALITKEGMK